MADLATTAGAVSPGASLLDRKMKKKLPSWISGAIVLVALIGGVGYIGFHVSKDLGNVTLGSAWPYVLLVVALLIALGFEFVNGFHDTANAVATVIYTHSLDPNIAVVWSGLCNLAGVLVVLGRGGLHRDHAAAGGTDSAGESGRRVSRWYSRC